ncbi:MAG: cytochrome C [Crocinitomicaceae bacterium]|nr:cytochrome C [Crocinitomicaceae bacterium]|tara:strand:+ start:2220 stop:2666 length:447 start_codon:yes stop_codon:yes gene_type:complete
MNKRPSKRSVLITLLIVFVAIQVKTTDKTPFKITPESDFLTSEEAPQEVTQLIQSACYDCHSNQTQYPWYSHVAPVSWWLERHINNGKSKVNFSIWDTYSPAQQVTLKNESAELIEKKWMPILTYKITHTDARLTEAQRLMLIDWLQE